MPFVPSCLRVSPNGKWETGYDSREFLPLMPSMKTEHTPVADPHAQFEAWYSEQVRLGLEDIEAGRVISDETVRAHFEKRFRQHAKRYS